MARKRLPSCVLALIALAPLFPPPASAEGPRVSSRYEPFEPAPSLGAAAEAGLLSSGGRVDAVLYPQLEAVVLKPVVAGVAPFDLGLVALGRVGFPLNGGTFSAGAAAGASLHFGLRGLGGPAAAVLDRLDLFAQAALGYDLVSDRGPGVAVSVAAGLSVFLTDSWALGLGFDAWTEKLGYGVWVRWLPGKD